MMKILCGLGKFDFCFCLQLCCTPINEYFQWKCEYMWHAPTFIEHVLMHVCVCVCWVCVSVHWVELAGQLLLGVEMLKFPINRWHASSRCHLKCILWTHWGRELFILFLVFTYVCLKFKITNIPQFQYISYENRRTCTTLHTQILYFYKHFLRPFQTATYEERLYTFYIYELTLTNS